MDAPRAINRHRPVSRSPVSGHWYDAVTVSEPSLAVVRPLRAVAGLPSVDELFLEYAPYVAKIGLRMLGRRSETDDFVQDVFLEAHKGLGQLRDPALAKSWLAGIAVNTARHRLRRRRLASTFFLDRPPAYLDVASPDASPEERMLVARICSALDQLPVDQRLAWSLRHLAGERLDDVAVLCGCSLATAKRHIAAAHEALREVIDG